MLRRPGGGDRSHPLELSNLDGSVEECDDPKNTLSVPEADSNSMVLATVPSSPMVHEETDSGILLEDGDPG